MSDATTNPALSEPGPPPGDTSGPHLIVSPASVAPEADIALILANPGTTDVTFGPLGRLDRWDGTGWQEFRQITTGLGPLRPAGGVKALDDEIMVPAIALVARPGSFADPVWTSLQGVDAGWYRLTLGSATGIVQVGGPDGFTVERPTTEVTFDGTTVVEAGSAAVLTLEAQLRDPVGRNFDQDEHLGRYTSTARVERHDGERWVAVPSATIRTIDSDLSSEETSFQVHLPVLAEGLYRVARDASVAGAVEALFWVEPLS
ncbi:hypothetical protein [Kineosporia sp. NBRC 101731]|uniref:hypothetical protein n=1 Tax=Kineosporia sp. NBRC 101731 TaxID=3032199 RepID=UPI0024A14998|nr:hypothetical protein [Kineosporia sp. NBRC 101731]GLY31909.1 hypothetical protein Kisp02_52740 [Kineosporia sp. NBRC 101731]